MKRNKRIIAGFVLLSFLAGYIPAIPVSAEDPQTWENLESWSSSSSQAGKFFSFFSFQW